MRLFFFAALMVLSAEAHATDFERYKDQLFYDDVKEMKADIKELTRKVTALDKEALTKTEARELRDSVNALQQQIARLEATTDQLPVRRINKLESRADKVEGDVGWMKKLLGFTAVQASLLTASLIVVGVAWMLNRKKGGNGGRGSWRGWPGARNWYTQESEK